jgi:hypothetical protein
MVPVMEPKMPLASGIVERDKMIFLYFPACQWILTVKAELSISIPRIKGINLRIKIWFMDFEKIGGEFCSPQKLPLC